ncbi:hypothetical protein Misp01_05120 [Microtetraspora sp. NBRC 13810]|uniref:phospholipid carrier-dependent glycosyltransferase n=1 Tax=Microtetraspora sp. NBRC 13810 TaxID=3030990 RepID=UPI0024A56542|nr:phospholipid carrier-dependent glycosyltransferase [Microtetraspora sp. NBRC 13810]GLW05382.1 hypothetical protein Misp01_05120 [Microtetraspora sp. NBRC 13810]
MSRLRLWLSRHRWFAGVLAAGAVLRVVTMLGYRPALWFPDSYSYVVTALRPRPDLVRPAGYSMFLRLFEPFHSFGVVALAQHVLGLAVGVLVYATARRLGAARWVATLASVPVLLDAYQIQLEHLLVSDTLFMFLVVAAVCLALSRPGRRIRWRTAGAIGLLVAAATLTRTVGQPLLVIIAGWLLARGSVLGAHADPRRESRDRAVRAGVMLAAAVVPLLAYGGWFYATYQRAGLVGANGVFLYARTMAFADCGVMRPPPDLAVLCDPRPPAQRPPSQEYVWALDSPLVVLPDITFSRDNDALAGRFASLAIRSQPLDYAASMLSELGRTFEWGRPVYPDQEIYDYYQFPSETPAPPGRHPAQRGVELAREYERGEIWTRVTEPFGVLMRGYQHVARLPGAVLLAVLLVPPVVAAVRWVRRRQAGRMSWTLPWLCSWVLVVMPPAVAEFDYRYVLPVVPLACLAAAVAAARERPPAER